MLTYLTCNSFRNFISWARGVQRNVAFRTTPRRSFQCFGSAWINSRLNRVSPRVTCRKLRVHRPLTYVYDRSWLLQKVNVYDIAHTSAYIPRCAAGAAARCFIRDEDAPSKGVLFPKVEVRLKNKQASSRSNTREERIAQVASRLNSTKLSKSRYYLSLFTHFIF